MTKLIASVAVLALVAGQVGAATAPAGSAPVVKVDKLSCATPAKSAKLSKAARVENRCESEPHKGLLGVDSTTAVFGGAVIAGVIAVAVATTNSNSPTSP